MAIFTDWPDFPDIVLIRVCEILENLNTLVVHLAPDIRVGDIAERRKVDPRDELPARSRQDHDLIRPILGNPIEGLHEVGMILPRKGQRATIAVELDYQHTVCISGHPQAAIVS